MVNSSDLPASRAVSVAAKDINAGISFNKFGQESEDIREDVAFLTIIGPKGGYLVEVAIVYVDTLATVVMSVGCTVPVPVRIGLLHH